MKPLLTFETASLGSSQDMSVQISLIRHSGISYERSHHWKYAKEKLGNYQVVPLVIGIKCLTEYYTRAAI